LDAMRLGLQDLFSSMGGISSIGSGMEVAYLQRRKR
jgi:hypothetical protein